ncbi:MAG TPA: M28 family peptidase [Terriglobia bacterium]|nr:M28 family peptidase [Terriglobia bacterium]
MTRIVLSALLILFQVPRTPADQLRQTTAAIAAGETTADRRAAITDRIKALGVEFHVEEFVSGTRMGSNVIASIPGKTGSRTLLLGAHYDRVSRGHGAVDNAASCAVLLQLMEKLKSNPPSNPVTFVFFDLEELGLLGSRSYFQTHTGSALPSLAMNFDIFGYGETFFVTPLKADGPLMSSFQQAAMESGFPVRSIPMTQYPSSDHRSMALAGIETLGVTLIDGSEIDSVIKPGPVPPRILSMIHTDADTMDQIREQDMAKALPVLDRTFRLLDSRP